MLRMNKILLILGLLISTMSYADAPVTTLEPVVDPVPVVVPAVPDKPEVKTPVQAPVVRESSVDRLEIATQQLTLLQSRLKQSERELSRLQQADAEPSMKSLMQASKNVLDKASLDIVVAKSNFDSINIEFTDAVQSVSWLNKNINEISNQLNVMKIFGSRVAANEAENAKQLRSDLAYQEKLLALETQRVSALKHLQDDAAAILQIKKDQLAKLIAQVKSQRLLRIRQQEVRDELAYQEQQNQWLQRLSVLYGHLGKLNPVSDKIQYERMEDQIFAANEQANYAYTESLMARYRDQIRQLLVVSLKNSSISQLDELSDQISQLKKQMDKLKDVMSVRSNALQDRLNLLKQKNSANGYVDQTQSELQTLMTNYAQSAASLKLLSDKRDEFNGMLIRATQVELSARQRLPSFDMKSFISIGKEILLVPALGFQVIKNLTSVLYENVCSAGIGAWALFATLQFLLLTVYALSNRLMQHLLRMPSSWREKINSKWLSLKWLEHHLIDLYLTTCAFATMFIFNVPLSNYISFVYLAGMWFIFKSMIVIARIALVETMNHTSDKDVRLYKRLKWTFGIGGIVTAAVVFIYQLPMIYELKSLSDHLFLLFMMMLSLVLLRYWDVVPNLILSHMENRHPYLQKSIRILGVLVPLLLFSNSAIGLLGYVNLIMSVSWYEGILLMVLIGYLVLRGLLSDSVEQFSRIVIQHSSNGWLLTEAFLKPLDRILRIILLTAASATLFLLYGWNAQSPIVERLNAILHYPLGVVYNAPITPIRVVGFIAVVSTFYWTAKWTREFVYRLLSNRTSDMGIRNSVAVFSQYAVIVLGIIISLQVLGIDSRALAAVTAAFAFGVGFGLRDLANNFFCGFLILLERPVRVGDIVSINLIEGEVTNIGSRAVTITTWDHTAYVVPNTEVYNKSFINLTARDNVVRSIVRININRTDNPHHVQHLIYEEISKNKNILSDPIPEVFLKEMNETVMMMELRYYVNIRQIRSRTMVISNLLIAIWEMFERNGIKPPYPQQEIFLRNESLVETTVMSLPKPEEAIN